MNPENWQQLKRLFHATLELEPDQRAAFLGKACNGDDELRSRVEKLLTSHDHAGSFLASPALVEAGMVATGEQVNDDHKLQAGQSIGPYEIIREIGHGGMGTVFLAVRADDQYRKQVASSFAGDLNL